MIHYFTFLASLAPIHHVQEKSLNNLQIFISKPDNVKAFIPNPENHAQENAWIIQNIVFMFDPRLVVLSLSLTGGEIMCRHLGWTKKNNTKLLLNSKHQCEKSEYIFSQKTSCFANDTSIPFQETPCRIKLHILKYYKLNF